MRRIVFAGIALTTLVAGVAQAQHAPTRRKIVEAIEIDAAADKVWAVVGNVKDSSWVEQVVGTREDGDDPAVSTRTLTLGSGRILVEKGRKYDAAPPLPRLLHHEQRRSRPAGRRLLGHEFRFNRRARTARRSSGTPRSTAAIRTSIRRRS